MGCSADQLSGLAAGVPGSDHPDPTSTGNSVGSNRGAREGQEGPANWQPRSPQVPGQLEMSRDHSTQCDRTQDNCRGWCSSSG